MNSNHLVQALFRDRVKSVFAIAGIGGVIVMAALTLAVSGSTPTTDSVTVVSEGPSSTTADPDMAAEPTLEAEAFEGGHWHGPHEPFTGGHHAGGFG